MKRKRRTECLLVGDAGYSQFRPALEWLTSQFNLTLRATPAMTLDTATAIVPAELIVLAQSRPGQFSADEVEALHRLWPLAKLVGLLGSWCEGETRSGRPWPGVYRIAAFNFVTRMRAMLDQRARSWSRSWQLPRLITDAERFYSDAADPLPKGTGLVRIAAATVAAFEPLADAVNQMGFDAIWQPHPTEIRPPEMGTPEMSPVATIWDAARGDGAEWQAIHDFARRYVPTPMLITLGFPRDADVRRGRDLSTVLLARPDRVAVLAKPFRIADGGDELVRLIGITDRTDSSVAGGDQKEDPWVRTSRAEYDACERPQPKSA